MKIIIPKKSSLLISQYEIVLYHFTVVYCVESGSYLSMHCYRKPSILDKGWKS